MTDDLLKAISECVQSGTQVTFRDSGYDEGELEIEANVSRCDNGAGLSAFVSMSMIEDAISPEGYVANAIRQNMKTLLGQRELYATSTPSNNGTQNS